MIRISAKDLDTIRNRIKQLKDGTTRWNNTWADVAEQFGPDRGTDLRTVSDHQDGTNKFENILDSTGIEAVRLAAAGLHSGLTPRARPWYVLQPTDPFMRRNLAVRRHLDDRADIQNSHMQRTNTYQAFHHTFTELMMFGVGCFAIDSNTIDGRAWRCIPFTAGEYKLDINSRGVVDTFYRRVRWTVKQIVDRWARQDDGKYDLSKVPIQIRQAWETGKLNQRFWLDHIIEPNDDRLDVRDAMGRPYRSLYMLDRNDVDSVLGVSGFAQFPIVCPRWDVTGLGVYGTSPCMPGVGPSRALQLMQRDGLKALAKLVDPPTQGQNREVSHKPGAHNTLLQATDSIKPLYEVRPDLGALLAYQQDKQRQIMSLLHADLFMMLNQGPHNQMTAYEVAERHSERLQVLGPSLDRLETELMEPVIRITGSILDEKGLAPPPPEEAQGVELTVEYTSVLAQAQELIGVRAIREWAGWADQVAARRPEVDDRIDWENLVVDLSERYHVPGSYLRPDEQVQAIRERRQQQAEQQQMIDQGQQQAQTAKTLAEAPMGDGTSVLNAMMGAQA